MPIGNSYPKDVVIESADLFLGTKAATNTTVNYTAQGIANYLNINGKISITGQMSFKFTEYSNLSKTISFAGGGGNNTPFSSITQFIVSTIDLSDQHVEIFLNYLDGKEILIARQNEINTFGNYKITGYAPTIDPNFYTLDLQYIGGNGVILKDNYYDIVAFGGAVPTLDEVLTAGNSSLQNAEIGSLYLYDIPYGSYGSIRLDNANFSLVDPDGIAAFNVKVNGFSVKNSGNFSGYIDYTNLTTNRNYFLPNASGTIALTSDIPSLTGYVQDTRTISTTTPLQGGGDLSANRTLSILQSNASQDGYLSSTDWNTFNNKQNAITLTTTGSSGSSTLVLGTLNVPTYTLSGLGGQPLATNLTSLSGLTYVSTSFVKMTAAGTFALDTNTYLTSAVTSVGMTVPSAFSVTPSTITSSGTFAITGAGAASQYVRGDGTLANFPTSIGGGASVSYYLNGSISQGTIGGVAYKEMNSVPVIGAGTDFTINADGYIAQFITDVGDPNKLLIPAGNWNFETYFSASSGGGAPKFYIELYKYDGATFTLIATNSATPENITGGTSIDLYFTALAIPQTTLLATDRLAVRFYVIHSGRTITMHTENSHLSQIITTFSTGLTALNGLTTQVQSFATGTSGTDFGISSATSTHTFNLPTASATNRGALSTTDWTTFNGKFNLPSLTSGSVLFSNGTTIAQDNANLFWDDTNNRLGIGTASPTAKLQIELADNGISTIFKSLGGQIRLRGYLSANYGAVIESFNPAATLNERLTLSGSKIQLLDGNVLVNTFTDNGGKLQIKAGGALSTDIALRVRNSVDSADLMTLGGTGTLNVNGVITTNAGNNVLALNLIGTTSSIQATPSSLRSNIIVNSQSVNTAVYANAGSFSAGIPNGVSFGSTTAGAKNTFGSLVTTAGGGVYMNFSTNGAESGFHITHNFGSDLMAVTSGGNVLINTTTDNGGKLQIKAPGALSTDIALRVRNSADSLDLLTMAGDGSLFVRALVKLGGNTDNISASSNSGFLDINTNQGIKMNPGSAFSTIFHSTGNVGIGITTPASSAKLDITSTTQGFLPPRMTTAQKNAIASPASGLVVYDTTLGKLCVRGASAWETITSI